MEFGQHVLTWIGNGLVFWAAAVGVASVVVHSRVKWWASRVGVHLMFYMSSMTLVLVLACVKIVFGDTWWFQLLRLVTFIAVPLAMSQRLILQLSVRRAARETPTEGDRRP